MQRGLSHVPLLLIFFMGCLHLVIPGPASGVEPFLIKFATLAPEGSTWMNHMRDLDKTLKAKSQGRLGFRVYPGGVAGDELDVLRKIRIGQIHAAAFSGVGFGQILPMVRVLDLPFLFRSDQEVDLVAPVRTIYDNYGFKTEILSCGRFPRAFAQFAVAGTDICTMRFEFIRLLYEHPYTDKRMQGFMSDWTGAFGEVTWPTGTE